MRHPYGLVRLHAARRAKVQSPELNLLSLAEQYNV